MSYIRNRIIGKTIYQVEATSYRDENGKPRTKEICLGHYDKDGVFIPSRKRLAEQTKTEDTTKSVIDNKEARQENEKTSDDKQKRTVAKAEGTTDEEHEIFDTNINALAIPTLPRFEHSLSLHEEGDAHLKLINRSTTELKFENGQMFLSGSLKPTSTVELVRDLQTREGIEHIDIPLLNVYYSIVLKKFYEKGNIPETLNKIATIYLPDLAEALGLGRKNLHKSDIQNIIDSTRKFTNIIGVLHFTQNGNPRESYFPVMNFEGYDAKTNTISFFSPYLNYVIKTIYNASIRTNKKRIPQLKKNGLPVLNPSHSYLVKPEIYKERNIAAVINVFIIITVIEQAGNNIPHISTQTIVDRNENLKLRLEKDSNHASRLLKRVFSKTWELLREKTRLTEYYDGIVLPDPKDISNIPIYSQLYKHTFTFPHNGKKNPQKKEKELSTQ